MYNVCLTTPITCKGTLLLIAKAFIPLLVPFLSVSPLYASHSSKVATPFEKKVIIPLNNWSSQRVISKAVGKILKIEKYPVEYREINTQDQWGALSRGLIHFQLEVWEPSMAEESSPFIRMGSISDLGSHSAKATENWWYPNYVSKSCPGLPDWRALNKCATLFSGDLSNKGIYYTGPWTYRDPDLIRSLKLNFVIVRYKDDQSIWKRLHEAIKEQKPIIMLNWSPNWTDTRIPGKFIHFPDYDPACESDQSWGINPNIAFDCGNKKNSWIKKYAWPELKQHHPCVYQFIKKIDLTNEMIAEAAALVDYDGFTEEESADLWLYKYRSQLGNWPHTTCRDR